jgi:hypothetical protein
VRVGVLPPPPPPLQAKVRSRDEEIGRLHQRLGAGLDLDRLTLQHKQETSEQMVLTLSQQVDITNTQLAELQQQVSRGGARLAPQRPPPARSPHLLRCSPDPGACLRASPGPAPPTPSPCRSRASSRRRRRCAALRGRARRRRSGCAARWRRAAPSRPRC